ncbi:uncharacterized protein EMH_0041050 [Eimeria mitis]|uniref:Transmembrane protein n=1 Tax=Eimeria mitis TaxID=44415 RepID=U6JUN6_9EIME|nr:uncharacterized protein EMH_0041050 [Eimeria mitis]CDJ28461.1 hypothetical protein EMH_0041050 [Eimeria mitis]
MGAANHCGAHRETFWLPRVLARLTLFAAAVATTATVSRAASAVNTPSGQTSTVSTDLPKNETARVHPYTPVDLVVGQTLGGLESSEIRTRQKQFRKSWHFAVTAGSVAFVCLLVAFIVLKCAREALFPRLFGYTRKRALSSSDLDEEWRKACADEGHEESEDDVGNGDPRHGGDSAEEAGELKALQTLEELVFTWKLGVEALPCLPFDKKAFLVVLLLTICTQQMVLYGIYSTPRIELKRQKTMDFILQRGQQALAELDALDQHSTAASQREKILEILEQFRTPRLESNPPELAVELAVEASICAYRVSQCRQALQQLQPWVKSSMPIPEKVSDRALRVLSYTRLTGKGRLKADPAANSWIETVQSQIPFFGIAEPRNKQRSQAHRRPLEEEMKKLTSRYRRLATALTRSVEQALRDQPLEQHMQEQRQHAEQQPQQDVNPKNQQNHNSASQHAENIGADTSVLRHVDHVVDPRTGVVLLSSHSSQPCRAPCQATLQTRISPLLSPPVRQQTQPPGNHSNQHIPSPQPEHTYQPSTPSVPSWGKSQQETNDQQQSSLEYFTAKSVLQVGAPVFTPRGQAHTYAQQQMSPTASGARDAVRALRPPRGFASPWQPADHSTSVQSSFFLAYTPSIPMQSQRGHHHTTFQVSASPHDSLKPLQRHSSTPEPLSGPCVTRSRPSLPTEGSSLGFPRPTFPSHASQNARSVATSLYPFSGGRRQIPASRFAAPAPFWPPGGEGARGGVYFDNSRETESLNPLLPLIAEAFPTVGTHWSDRDEMERHGQEALPRFPRPQQLPASRESSDVFLDVESSIRVSTGGRGASPALEAAPQSQGGAGNLQEYSGVSRTQ